LRLPSPLPPFLTPPNIYLPAIRPIHPNPALTASSLHALAPGILIERYACAQDPDTKCKNKGTCVHYYFVLGARRTPDGLVCRLCKETWEMQEASQAGDNGKGRAIENDVEVVFKGVGGRSGKRSCPWHAALDEGRAKSTPRGVVGLACDYLATEVQRLVMGELLERAWRNEWVGEIAVGDWMYAVLEEVEEGDQAVVEVQDDAVVEELAQGALQGEMNASGPSRPQDQMQAPPSAQLAGEVNSMSSMHATASHEEAAGEGEAVHKGKAQVVEDDSSASMLPQSAPAGMQSFGQDPQVVPDDALPSAGLDDLFDDSDLNMQGWDFGMGEN
jgi:hypothetical protein